MNHNARMSYQLSLFDTETGLCETVAALAAKALCELDYAGDWLEGIGDMGGVNAKERGIEVGDSMSNAVRAVRDVTVLMESLQDSLRLHTNEYRIDSMRVGNLVKAVEAAISGWK